MSSTDEIWESMNEAKPVVIKNTKKLTNKLAVKKNTSVSEFETVATKEYPILSYDEMKVKLSREVNASNDDKPEIRKKALRSILKILQNNSMSVEDYGRIFRDFCKSVFKRYADPVENCRELAQRITIHFFGVCSDFSPILGYYFPALMQRLPTGLAYDDDMKVFVVDMEAHEAYRRGKAMDRQDKVDSVSGILTHQVVEPSEEIRLLTCTAILTLLKKVREENSCTVLHAYFQDMVMFVQAQLRDPYPELKMVACNILELLAIYDDFEIGMKLYAVGLVRGLLPVLRHRHAKVRIAALTALRFVITVPDRAKRKAAGSDAICDMVGFREENVLQIAAFYRPDVQLNYLAELVNDKSVQVREKLAYLLTELLTIIDDRYDHQTRLLPYLLDLLTDDAPTVSSIALACLVTCGRQYEEDHYDEIVERRQYGVDGDDRINLDKPFPAPFSERPRLGIRLFVRGNTKRFLSALVNELTNWVSHTRLKSAQLLKMVIVLCEEHLTMEIHTLLPSFIKALRFARDDNDHDLHAILLEVYELLGRYIAPEVYIYYLLPRLRGDVDIVQFGVDAETRITVMEFLQALLQGSKPLLIPPFFEEIVAVLTDPFVISPESMKLQQVAMDVLLTMLRAMKGKSNAVVEAHFVATGRLTNLKSTIRQAFRFLLLNISNPELHSKAFATMTALYELEFDGNFTNGSVNNCGNGVLHLFSQHGASLFKSLIEKYELDSAWTSNAVEHILLCRLVECPNYVLICDESTFEQLLIFLCTQCAESLSVHASREVEENILIAFSQLMISSLQPLYCDSFESTNACVYHEKLSKAFLQSGIAQIFPDSNGLLMKLSEVVTSHINKIMAAFVLDIRWNRSPRLQLQRLKMLSALVSTQDDGTVAAHRASPVLSGSVLAHHCSSIFDTLITSAVLPTNPVELRVGVFYVTSNILSALCDYVSRSRLKSFDYWRGSPDATNEETVLRCKVSVHKAIVGILSGLDDGSDDVRAKALQALATYGANLILKDSDNVDSYLTYSDVTKKLLSHLSIDCESNTSSSSVMSDSDNIVDYLDSALRSLAVLDPTTFEQLVRDALPPVRNNGDNCSVPSDKYVEILSGLISHVDVLKQFSK